MSKALEDPGRREKGIFCGCAELEPRKSGGGKKGNQTNGARSYGNPIEHHRGDQGSDQKAQEGDSCVKKGKVWTNVT